MNDCRQVIVVGGGLIGLCAAHSLLRKGYSVTIVERSELGAGAARGNAGEVTPLQVAPLASPQLVRDLVRGVLTSGHYLSIDIRKLLHLAPFGVGFFLRSRKLSAKKGLDALQQLAVGMYEAFDRYADEGVTTGDGGTGYLFSAADAKALGGFHRAMTSRSLNHPGSTPTHIMIGEELHSFEPALAPGVDAGVLLPAERYFTPGTFVDNLIAHLTFSGVKMMESVEAQKVGVADGKPFVEIRRNGDSEVLKTDKVVVAAGAWTQTLLRRSGVRSKVITPGKGYSFYVDTQIMPKVLVHSFDEHIVAIPMSDGLRVTGSMEFDTDPDKFNSSRLTQVTDRASRVLQGVDWESRRREWVGPRPMTSDGLPAIDYVPGTKDIVVAAGHNMHGLSLGPLTGDIVAALVAAQKVEVAGKALDRTPFALNA